jgi:hypothetical protein
MAIKPPAFQKDATPSLKGWHHPRTNELLKCARHTQDQVDAYMKPAKPVEVEEVSVDIEDMSKKELELFAREHLDVELDRRKSKETLLNQLVTLMKR